MKVDKVRKCGRGVEFLVEGRWYYIKKPEKEEIKDVMKDIVTGTTEINDLDFKEFKELEGSEL